MNWTSLIWILLYFTVGWIFTEIYDLDGDIWELLIFLGWPLLVAGILVILVLLVLFGLAFGAEELLYRLRHKGRTNL